MGQGRSKRVKAKNLRLTDRMASPAPVLPHEKPAATQRSNRIEPELRSWPGAEEEWKGRDARATTVN